MRTTVSLPDDLAEHVDDVRASADDSDAQAIRDCVRRSQQLAECRRERDAARAQVDELRSQLMHANQRIDAANEIVAWAESERSLEERRARAGLATRAKWWLFGMDDGD